MELLSKSKVCIRHRILSYNQKEQRAGSSHLPFMPWTTLWEHSRVLAFSFRSQSVRRIHSCTCWIIN